MQSTGENTEDTKTPDCFAQLGHFCKFSVEIRFLIWEQLFCLDPLNPTQRQGGYSEYPLHHRVKSLPT